MLEVVQERSSQMQKEGDQLTLSKVHSLFRKLGFKQTKFWFYPQVDKSDRALGENMFATEKELKLRLARFSLPETCDFEQITLREHISLEVHLISEISCHMALGL